MNRPSVPITAASTSKKFRLPPSVSLDLMNRQSTTRPPKKTTRATRPVTEAATLVGGPGRFEEPIDHVPIFLHDRGQCPPTASRGCPDLGI